MSPTSVRDKRRICIPCVVGLAFVLVSVAAVLFWFFVAWTQRGVIQQALASADSIAEAAPVAVGAVGAVGGACCGGCGPCAGSFEGALSVFGQVPLWPMLPILALLIFFAFVVFVGTLALILLLTGANPATLTQLGTLLTTAVRLLPQVRDLAEALRTTALGLDQGKTAASAMATGLGSAAGFVGRTAASIGAVDIPGRNWRLHSIAGTIFYNIEKLETPPNAPFHDVAADLRNAEGQISAASTKSGDLAKAFEEAAKRLREAATVLDGMGTP